MAVIRQGKPNRVCIHHSAVFPGAKNKTELKKRLAAYEVTHSKKPWAQTIKTKGEYGYRYLEYHIAVAKDGTVIRAQDDKYVLYHAGDNARGKESFNLHGIAILLDGNYQQEGPTPAQTNAVVKLIKDFQIKYKVDAKVRGHKETSLTGTSCPGANLGTSKKGWIRIVIDRVNAPVVVVPPPEVINYMITVVRGAIIRSTSIGTDGVKAVNEYNNCADIGIVTLLGNDFVIARKENKLPVVIPPKTIWDMILEYIINLFKKK